MQWCERTINGQQKYTFKARVSKRFLYFIMLSSSGLGPILVHSLFHIHSNDSWFHSFYLFCLWPWQIALGVQDDHQDDLFTINNESRNRFGVTTFNSGSKFGFKDWSSSKYQNPIPWSNNWNWISKERKHFCLFSFQNLLINLIDLSNFSDLWKDLLQDKTDTTQNVNF